MFTGRSERKRSQRGEQVVTIRYRFSAGRGRGVCSFCTRNSSLCRPARAVRQRKYKATRQLPVPCAPWPRSWRTSTSACPSPFGYRPHRVRPYRPTPTSAGRHPPVAAVWVAVMIQVPARSSHHRTQEHIPSRTPIVSSEQTPSRRVGLASSSPSSLPGAKPPAMTSHSRSPSPHHCAHAAPLEAPPSRLRGAPRATLHCRKRPSALNKTIVLLSRAGKSQRHHCNPVSLWAKIFPPALLLSLAEHCPLLTPLIEARRWVEQAKI